MKKYYLFLFLFFSVGFSVSAEDKATQIVLAKGLGSTIETAAKDAAENALTQVVGSFLDVETQISKRIEISEGVKKITKEVNSRMNEYSQGSIKSFEILDSNQEGGLFRVEAKVEVRIDDFKAYVKELAKGEATLSTGLFAQVATIEDQTADRQSIVLNKILLPLLSGEASEFEVGAPELLKESEAYKENKIDWSGIERNINPRTIIIPFLVKIKSGFLDNVSSTLDEISDKKLEGDYRLKEYPDRGKRIIEIVPARGPSYAYELNEICDDNAFEKPVLDMRDKLNKELEFSYFCKPTGQSPMYSIMDYDEWRRRNYSEAELSFSPLIAKLLDFDGLTLDQFAAGERQPNTDSIYIVGVVKNSAGKSRVLPYFRNYTQLLNIGAGSKSTVVEGKYNSTTFINEIKSGYVVVNLPSEKLSLVAKIQLTFKQ